MRMPMSALAITLVGVIALTSTSAYGSSTPVMTAKQFEVVAQKDVNEQQPEDKRAGETTKCAYVQSEATAGYIFTCVTTNRTGKLLASTQIFLMQPKGDLVRWKYLVTAPTPPRATYTVTGIHVSTAEVTYADGTNTVEKYHVHLPFTVVVLGTGLPLITANDSSNASDASITCKLVVAGYPPVTNTGSGSYSEAASQRTVNYS
jgi:Mycobacterium membrane protein